VHEAATAATTTLAAAIRTQVRWSLIPIRVEPNRASPLGRWRQRKRPALLQGAAGWRFTGGRPICRWGVLRAGEHGASGREFLAGLLQLRQQMGAVLGFEADLGRRWIGAAAPWSEGTGTPTRSYWVSSLVAARQGHVIGQKPACISFADMSYHSQNRRWSFWRPDPFVLVHSL